jgi:2-keto-4-pentenoate hydratase
MRRRHLLPLACATLLPPSSGSTARAAACPTDAAVAELAAAMVEGRPAEPFAGLGMAEAECARDKLVPLLVEQFGRVVGHKVGLADAEAQRRRGLDRPVRGALFDSALAQRSGVEIPLRPPLTGLAVEPDLLVRVRDEGVNTAGRDHVATLRHLDQVIPFVGLPRNPFSRPLDGPGLVAGNLGARLGVVASPMPVEATPEFARRLGAMLVVFGDDTGEIARAPGTALLGHPLDAVAWLVEDLARGGQRLRARDYVALGGFAPPVPAQAGRTYVVRYEGLAARPVGVSVRFR